MKPVMKPFAVLVVLGLLAACGADGDPVRPSMTTHVGVGSSGVHSSTSISATTGNVSLTLGL